jgi:hypothetical protein
MAVLCSSRNRRPESHSDYKTLKSQSVSGNLQACKNHVPHFGSVILVSLVGMVTDNNILWHVCQQTQLLLVYDSGNKPTARRWLSGRHVMATTDTYPAIEELLEVAFSVRSIVRRGGRWCEMAASLQGRWKTLPSSAVKPVTETTGLCVTVISKVQSQDVC